MDREDIEKVFLAYAGVMGALWEALDQQTSIIKTADDESGSMVRVLITKDPKMGVIMDAIKYAMELYPEPTLEDIKNVLQSSYEVRQ